MGPFPGGPPPGGPPQGPPDQGGGVNSASQLVKSLIQGAIMLQHVEQDEQDKLILQKVMTLLQQILANDQKDADAAMGTTPAHRAMRSAYGA